MNSVFSKPCHPERSVRIQDSTTVIFIDRLYQIIFDAQPWIPTPKRLRMTSPNIGEA